LSWNDYELNRRAIEMKSTASLFGERMRDADVDGMKTMAEAMKRSAEMALARIEEVNADHAK
jgi:hypothetical protein